jgi:dihydrodipicolinate synthase/N-acetylneuraminate lyase
VIRGQIARAHNNLYLFGTAGEGYAVTLRQFERISRIFVEETEGKTKWRQLGIIALSLPQVRERIELGRSMSVDSFQLSFPSWGRLNDREVDLFFEGTCGLYPQCSFLFYNVARGLRFLSAQELRILADRHTNLVAVKWAGRLDQPTMKLALESVPQLCHFFTDIGYVEASLMGLTCGFLIAMASSNRPLASELFDLGRTRANYDRLRKHYADLAHHSKILRELPVNNSHMDGTFDKLICKLHHRDFPLRLLPPYQGSTDEVFKIYLARMEAELPHWLERVSPWGRIQEVCD